jgi:hypothetical protein
MKTLFALLALTLALPAMAQAPAGDGMRGSTPPGMSRDGSAPGDGALKGGSIAPGESAGMPDRAPTERARNRCNDLSGVLREQCLKQEQEHGASTGGRTLPGPAVPPSPREAPPPQNPR